MGREDGGDVAVIGLVTAVRGIQPRVRSQGLEALTLAMPRRAQISSGIISIVNREGSGASNPAYKNVHRTPLPAQIIRHIHIQLSLFILQILDVVSESLLTIRHSKCC